MKFKLRKERDFSENLSSTFDFFRMNYKMILRIFFKIPGPLLLIAVLLIVFGYANLYGSAGTINPDSASLGSFGIFFLGMIIYSVSSMLFSASINEFIVLYESSPNPDDITVAMVYKNARSVFWSYLGGALLVGIMVFVGFLLLFIPGVYLGVSFAYIFIVLSAEKLSVTDGISRCFKIVKGYWWRTLGYSLVIGIMIMFISYIIQLPLLILNSYTLVSQGPDSFNSFYGGLTAGIGYVFFLALSSISVIAIAMYYYSIVEAKEQTGLKQEISKMDDAPEINTAE